MSKYNTHITIPSTNEVISSMLGLLLCSWPPDGFNGRLDEAVGHQIHKGMGGGSTF